MNEPVDEPELKRILRAVLSVGELRFTRHAQSEMAKDNLVEQDVRNVLRGGRWGGCDFERGGLAVSSSNRPNRGRYRAAVGDRGRCGDGMERAMTCMMCGGKMGAPTAVSVPYNSLPGTLLAGVHQYTCEACGETEIAIPRMDELNDLLAGLVAGRRGRLAGAEIRFLRKHLGWSGEDFARMFDVDPPTVSRWENGKQRMDQRAEMLLRVSATRMRPIGDYAEYEAFLQLPQQQAEPNPVRVQWAGEHWAAAA